MNNTIDNSLSDLLPDQLLLAQNSIDLPEVQEMMQKLASYNLGVYMPHMHSPSGAMQVMPDDVFQVEDDLMVSFASEDPPEGTYVPVAWAWSDGPRPGAKCKSICTAVHHCE